MHISFFESEPRPDFSFFEQNASQTQRMAEPGAEGGVPAGVESEGLASQVLAKVRGRRLPELAVLCFFTFISCSPIIIFAVTPQYYQNLLSLSPLESSLLSSSPLLCVAVLSVPIALLARHYGSCGILFSFALFTSVFIFVLAAIIMWADVSRSLFPLFVFIGLYSTFALLRFHPPC